jgi:hypothetical protein
MNNDKLFIFHKPSSKGLVVSINDMIEQGLIDSVDEFTEHGVNDLMTHNAVYDIIIEKFNRHAPVTPMDYDVTWYLELQL